MRALILGASGMLGSAVFHEFVKDGHLETWGTLRSSAGKSYFSTASQRRLISGVDVLESTALENVFSQVEPEIVVNCVGLIKQLATANDPLVVLPINALLPHRLANLCDSVGARLIHISTDCVFSGKTGMYTEDDVADAEDLYGISKHIGEVIDRESAITLRTSIIGHELNSQHALVDWFLAQKNPINGYTKAIFSGLPTIELARIILDFVIPSPELSGLFHVSAEPIDKFSLLRLVAQTYGKQVEINPDSSVCIDRSLDSSRFRDKVGYQPKPWPELVSEMFRTQNQKVAK